MPILPLHAHQASTFSAGVLTKVWEGSNERLGTSSGSMQEMRHSVPSLASPPYLGNSKFLWGYDIPHTSIIIALSF